MFPKNISTYIEPFVGSGTVMLNVQAEHYLCNDINEYIIDIIRGIVTEKCDNYILKIEQIINEYQLSKTNEQGFLKLREHYNKSNNKSWIELYTLMCYSFNYQFRCNNNREYNSSFGKNRSSFSSRQKSLFMRVSELNFTDKITLSSVSIFKYLDELKRLWKRDKTSFMYLDPPYYNSCGNYNDGARGFENWTLEHEKYLLDTVIPWANKNDIKWALSNDLSVNNVLEEWLKDKNYNVHEIKNSYSNSNYQKKNKSKNTREVLITNY